jgi:hypothetical protein
MLCDGGAYAFSNLEVPTGLTERSLDMLMLVWVFPLEGSRIPIRQARRIGLSPGVVGLPLS